MSHAPVLAAIWILHFKYNYTRTVPSNTFPTFHGYFYKMKLVYADFQPAPGVHVAGICSVYIAPRQWLAANPAIDFTTGKVLNAVALLSNKFWIRMDLIEDSYLFDEDPKDSKSGDYKETTLTGTLNYYGYDLQQILETLRRSQLVVLLTDMNKRRRLAGDADNAMRFTYKHTQKNDPRQDIITINMIMQTEDPAPFYNPDNEPEIIYNLLENIDGNFLLVE